MHFVFFLTYNQFAKKSKKIWYSRKNVVTLHRVCSTNLVRRNQVKVLNSPAAVSRRNKRLVKNHCENYHGKEPNER